MSNLPVIRRNHEALYGSVITKVELIKDKERRWSLAIPPDESFMMHFQNGERIIIVDDGQDCCESRYMTTDDDIQSLVGHALVSISGKEAQATEGDWLVHEIVFVEIQTTGGFITLVNHNDHNGYYSGFQMMIQVWEPGSFVKPAF